MTNEEAIEALKNVYKLESELVNGKLVHGYINPETLENRAIDLAIQALEKQIAKKVICEIVEIYGPYNEYELNQYMCPGCENIINQHYKKSNEPIKYPLRPNYCNECGQKLRWSDEK